MVCICVQIVFSLYTDGHLGWSYDLAIENNRTTKLDGGCTPVISTLRNSHMSEANLSYITKLCLKTNKTEQYYCEHVYAGISTACWWRRLSYVLRSGLSGSHCPFFRFLCEWRHSKHVGSEGSCRCFFSTTWLPGGNSALRLLGPLTCWAISLVLLLACGKNLH